ncbi:DUF3822 family protein [Flavicella sp.]|uniref:DUF3822 family protein n=1 Tax=Flavicella sp. TaxID=2957742 RepID=UPI003016C0E7
MTERVNNIKLNSVESTDLKETRLSIQINLDGFSFCIYSLSEKKPIVFQRFNFEEKASTPERHLAQIENIFFENEFLKESFERVTIIHQNELSSLVPTELFDKNHLKDYIKNSVKTLPIDYLSYDNIDSINATTVYIPFVNINNFFLNYYGSFEYYHSFTQLAILLTKEDLTNSNDKIFVHVNQNSFELLAFKKNKLQVINKFDFLTAEDFIYYVLFVVEQLSFDCETLNLILLGDIQKESELFAIIYKYIRNIKFYTNTIKRPIEFNEIPKHSNFILLNQY